MRKSELSALVRISVQRSLLPYSASSLHIFTNDLSSSQRARDVASLTLRRVIDKP